MLPKTKLRKKIIVQILSLIELDSLFNNYYMPFIKSKLEYEKVDYKKEIKELDKEKDRIKTAYIKGIVKLDEFNNELKQIEFKRQNLIQKQKDIKQYENLNFTVDDLLLIRDKKAIDCYLHPENFIKTLQNWNSLSKEEKQKIISTYIDNIEITKDRIDVNINNVNYRKSFYYDLISYRDKYDFPLDTYAYVDKENHKIPCSQNVLKTKSEVQEYVHKLKEIYDVNYYEVMPNDESNMLTFPTTNKVEKIIRVIPLKDKNNFKNKTKLGVITINLSDINYNKMFDDIMEN